MLEVQFGVWQEINQFNSFLGSFGYDNKRLDNVTQRGINIAHVENLKQYQKQILLISFKL